MRASLVRACALWLAVLVATSISPAQTPDPIAPSPNQGTGIDQVQQHRNVVTQLLQAQVAADLEVAREEMAAEPDRAKFRLKLALDVVSSATEVDPDVRQQLADTLKSAVRHAARREVELDEQRREQQETEAQQAARRRSVEDEHRKQDKVDALMQRFEALLDEHRFEEAEQEVAAEALFIDPDNPSIEGARIVARRLGAHEEFSAIAEQRSKARTVAMLATERAAIASVTDDSVTYPVTEVWQEMTQRRRRLASVDLRNRGKAADRIMGALDESTRMDFEELSLDDVTDFIREFHDVEVLLDRQALAELGVDGGAEVTFRVRGISLRSALRLMLRTVDPAMTYAIKDEVLLITTQPAVEEFLATRVYPVGDLVVPIQNLDFVGRGGFSGAAGRQGFGAGAFGGGQKRPGGANANPLGPGDNLKNPFGDIGL